MHFVLNALSIVLIDLLLAGDNALIIAMAVRSLSPKERRLGILVGALGAVALRVGLTFVAAQLLTIEYVELAGGLLVLWIAYRVLRDASEPPESAPAPRKFFAAIAYIILADVTMSTDNILAIAGASHGDLWLILFGLAVSIPFVVFSSNLLSKLMDRFPWLIWLGAAILGKVAGDMIVSDPAVVRALHPTEPARYLLDAALVAGLLLASRLLRPVEAR
jgi:YjbE family integral membrane protein